MAINFPNNPTTNLTYTSGSTTWIWDGTAWNVDGTYVQSTNPGFSTIEVAGQPEVVANSGEETLTVVAGTNITITTNNTAKSLTINSTAEGGGGVASNSFSTISVTGQNNVVADSSTDILTLIAGTGITVTTNATNDSITINNSTTAFSNLTDVTTASLTVDKFYLPAMTMLDVTNSGASAYRFDQYGSSDNPTIYAITGTTIAFDLNATGHPFLIQTPSGVNYNTGLVHVTPAGVVTTGAAAQGKDSGTLYWKVPTDISGGYRYQCSIHAPMVGSITVKTINTL
jgi:plastocyanin